MTLLQVEQFSEEAGRGCVCIGAVHGGQGSPAKAMAVHWCPWALKERRANARPHGCALGALEANPYFPTGGTGGSLEWTVCPLTFPQLSALAPTNGQDGEVPRLGPCC